jgi:hypothetical protein
MNTDNTNRDAEPSLASAGSQPVAWAVTRRTDGWIASVSMFERTAECEAGRRGDGWSAVPLYRPPTLTDAEQLAIAWAAREADEWDEEDTPEVAAHAEVLRGLAKRLF